MYLGLCKIQRCLRCLFEHVLKGQKRSSLYFKLSEQVDSYAHAFHLLLFTNYFTYQYRFPKTSLSSGEQENGASVLGIKLPTDTKSAPRMFTVAVSQHLCGITTTEAQADYQVKLFNLLELTTSLEQNHQNRELLNKSQKIKFTLQTLF